MARSEIVPIVYSDVFTGSPTEDDLRRILASWPVDSALDLIGRVSALMRFSHQDYRTPEFQRIFVEHLHIDGYGQPIIALLPDRTFLYPEQLAILIKNLVRYGAGKRWPDKFGDSLAQALLIISQFRTAQVAVAKAGSAAKFIPIEVAGMFGFEDPYVNKLLVYASFFKWASTDIAQAHPAFCEVVTDFEELVGISWPEYMAVTYGLLLFFKQITTFEILTKYSFILPPEYLSRFNDQQIISRWLDLNSINLADLASELGDRWADSHLGATLFPLKQRPFVRLSGDRLVCPYIPFLENAGTSGLFYRLADSYYRKDPKKSRNLRTFFGHFLELYSLRIFREISQARGYYVEGDKTYNVGRFQRHGSDIFVFDGHDALFVEVTSTRFREIDSLVELRDEFIDQDITRLIDKIKELDEDVRDFRDGHLVYDEIKPSAVERIFPMIITSFSVPHFVGIVTAIRDAISSNKWLEGTQPLEVVEVQALDLLEADLVSTIRVFDLLATKQSATVRKPASLMNFVALRGGEVGLDHPISKPQSLLEIEDELRSRFNSWGGPQIQAV